MKLRLKVYIFIDPGVLGISSETLSVDKYTLSVVVASNLHVSGVSEVNPGLVGAFVGTHLKTNDRLASLQFLF